MIESFFLHFYAYAEVYAVLSAWTLIPLVYLFALLWLKRQGAIQIQLGEGGTPTKMAPVFTPPREAVPQEQERAVGSD